MTIQAGEMSPGEVRCLPVRRDGQTGRWGVSRCGEMTIQAGEMSPGELRCLPVRRDGHTGRWGVSR